MSQRGMLAAARLAAREEGERGSTIAKPTQVPFLARGCLVDLGWKTRMPMALCRSGVVLQKGATTDLMRVPLRQVLTNVILTERLAPFMKASPVAA